MFATRSFNGTARIASPFLTTLSGFTLKNCRNKKLHREKLALTHFSHAKLREHLNAPWAPVAKPLASRSRDHGNVEAPCPDQRPQRRELGNIALACCPWNSGIWQTAKTDAPTLLRNSSTQHWIPFQAPPTCGKFVNSLSGKSSHARIILDSCHNSMSIRWCKYAATEQHKKHACTFTRPVLQRVEEHRHR